MKLALVTETFPPEINGVAMTFGTIAAELGRRGHFVTVYRPRRSDLPDPRTHPQYDQHSLPGIPIPGYPLLRMGLPSGGILKRLWRIDRPSLVHVATEGPLGVSAIHAARSLGIPVTSSFHTNFHSYMRHYRMSPFGRVAIGWLRWVHNRTLRTFVPTEEVKAELAAERFSNLHILSRGVDTRSFGPDRRSAELRRSWGALDGDPVVLHVGRVAAEKNYSLLFRIYEAMRAANPSCRFVIAGEGPLKKALMKRHRNCIFEGFFSRDDIGRYYASADIYIHASLTETFGNVLTEGLASGLAVAGFDYAAARIFIRDGCNGLLAPCDQPEKLLAAGVRLACEPELRHRLRLVARSSVEAQSWENVIARFDADLETVAESVSPAEPANTGFAKSGVR